MIGKTFKTNNSGKCVVVDYINYENVTIEFVDTGYKTKTRMDNLIRGKVKDYLYPSVYNQGILGVDFCNDEVKTKQFMLWKNMLKRCYSEVSLKESPTYHNCKVSDNFVEYPYFKEWCNKQIGHDKVGWQLDKDILVKGNKIYSEDTCCFVPKEINLAFVKKEKSRGDYLIGVDFHTARKQYRARCSTKHLGWFSTELEAFQAYKQAKEAYIKEVANKWKDQIDHRVYEALMNYQVGITD